MKTFITIVVILGLLALGFFVYEYKTDLIVEKEAYEVVKTLFK